MSGKQKRELGKIILSAVLLGAAVLVFALLSWDEETLAGRVTKIAVFALIYLILGIKVMIRGVENLFSGELLDENFLMALASVGAFFVGEYVEGAAVVLFYSVGEWFQSVAVGQSRKRISALTAQMAEVAHVVGPEGIYEESPENVPVGSLTEVRPGEKIPLDGVVEQGTAGVNLVSLTGESLPQTVAPGSPVYGGTVSMDGLLRIRTTKPFEESSQEKILEMVENASVNKSKAENFITRFANVYTPCVVGAALLLALIPSIVTGNWTEWIRRALIFLVVSCPCALVISVPLCFFSAIGKASRRGILVKGANYLEQLARCGTAVFDKTGTLTTGEFRVLSAEPADGVSEEELRETGAIAEAASNHPVARAVLEFCGGSRKDFDRNGGEWTEIPGKGVKCVWKDQVIYAGNSALYREIMKQSEEKEVFAPDEERTFVSVVKNHRYLGRFLLGDRVKDSAEEAVAQLKKAGVTRLTVLTGDVKAAADRCGEALGIPDVRSGLFPEDKLKAMEEILAETRGTAVYVGDGINDAPVLALADVGVAMGGIGQDAAMEAADCVILNDDLRKLAEGIRIGRKAVRIAKENIVFAIAVKIGVLVLAALGFPVMWAAVFADVGVLILAILNALR